MIMNSYWKTFFNNYRQIEIKSDQDLYFQVGKSVAGKPISEEDFKSVIDDVKSKLQFSIEDKVLDLCCGNGVLTFEIAKTTTKVIGIDFSEPFIKNAQKYKYSSNIDYICNDVLEVKNILSSINFVPNKILMHGSLAYFNSEQLGSLLAQLSQISSDNFTFLASSVPNNDKKWLFYNTIYRKFDYILNSVILKKDKGIGNWWNKKNIETLCKKHFLNVKIVTNNSSIYRMDILISR